MASWTYVEFTDRMIKRYEGGYCWDKADPGGPTKYGITCFDLAEHMGQKMDSMSRWAPIVKAMTLDTATTIYRKKYAAKIRYDELNAGVDACLYDYGVNSGYARAIRVARSITGTPGNGSVMDAALVAAVNARDPDQFINAVCDERLRFMHAIRGGSAWAVFGKGWGARVADLRAICHHYVAEAKAGRRTAQSAQPTAPDLTKTATPKAQHGSPNTVPNVVKGSVASAGTSTAGIVGSGLPEWVIPVAIGAVIVIGILVVIYQRHKALRLNATVAAPVLLPAAAAA